MLLYRTDREPFYNLCWCHIFEFKLYFDTESYSEPDEDFLYFSVQERLIDNTTSLDNIDQDILPPKYGEQLKAIQNTTLLCHLLFHFLFYKLVRMLCPPIVTLVLSDSSSASFDISDIDPSIVFRKGKDTCTSYPFINSYSHLSSSYSVFIFSVDS